MRGQKILLIVLFAGTMALPNTAQAQFSPRGIIGAFTHPLREMLGRFGHFPRGHRSTAAQEAHPSGSPSAQFGDVGPAGWPSAYEDIVGFTFWPGRYAGQMRAHGFDVVAGALMGAGRGPELARNTTTGSAVQSDSNGNAAEGCREAASAKVEWPASQLEQDGKLDDAQHSALARLQSAVTESIKAIKLGCRDLHSLQPLERLKATVQELWSVRDAGINIRPSLKVFYDSLSNEQKAGFDWRQPADRAKQTGKPDNGAMAQQYQACASPGMESSERMLKDIEEKVQPNKQQTESLEALRKTSADMAKLLTASCAQPIPADPVARLDVANDQLSSLSFAATSVELALNGLYAQLDDEQKAKFNSPGR